MLSAGVTDGVVDVVVVFSFVVTFLAAVDVPDAFLVVGLAVVVVFSFVVTFLGAVDVPDAFLVVGLAVVLCPAVDDAVEVAFVAIGLVVAGTAVVV